MPIEKGKSGNPNGRPKGTPNKSTNELRNIFQSLLEANLENIQKDLDSLEPKDRLQLIFRMATFCLPTLQSQNIVSNKSNISESLEIINKLFE
jgi:hypothetical protein